MISDGMELIIVHSRQKYEALLYTFHTISLVVICIFGISLLIHKMIGLEILRPSQTIYLLFTISNNRTPLFSVISFLANASYNYLHFTDHSWNIETPMKSIYFNQQNNTLTCRIVLASIILPAVGLVGLLIIKFCMSNSSDNS